MRKTVLFFCLFLLSAAAVAQDIAVVPPSATPDANRLQADAPPDLATATAVSEIEPKEHHWLRRPIELSDDKIHWVDRTYPYGSTQWNTRSVHLGVEFVNPRFTPVYAAEAGRVVFAGEDADVLVGPYKGYYGNVIILAHDFRSLDNRPVFTLYAHLDRVEVENGQEVQDGQRLGRVGSSGIALGAHLHFEVRVDDPFDYQLTRNPALWLQYYIDHGMIAGFVHDAEGEAIEGRRIVVRSDDVYREVFTYGAGRVNRDPVWGENFTVSDLPQGSYEIAILDAAGRLAYRSEVKVEAYQTAFLDVLIES